MSLDKIYREGASHYSQEGEYRNPYPNGSPEFNEFERGWTQALKRTNASCVRATLPMASYYPEERISRPSAYDDPKLSSELYKNRKG